MSLRVVGDAAATSRASLALAAGGMVSWAWDIASDAVLADEGFGEMWGLSTRRMTARAVFGAMHPDDLPRVKEQVEAALTRDEDYVTEFRVCLPDGRHRWLGARGRVTQRGPDGTPLRMLGVNWDKTEQKLQEERLSIFAAEMNHRVENGFALMAALVQLGARAPGDKADYAERLRGQVQALADAHRLTVAAERGEGPGLVPARAVIERALAAWATDPARLTLAFRAAPTLEAPRASALAMLTYELMTNAVKYGALGQPDGRLTVVLDDAGHGDARLRWRERAPGAAAPVPSDRKGFGSVLLDHCAAKLRGTLTREAGEGGLVVALTFPARGLDSGVTGQRALAALMSA